MFNEKSNFLLGPESTYDFQEIYLADFFKYVFARDVGNTDPFEDTMSPEYMSWKKKRQEWLLRLHEWQKNHGKNVPYEGKINYDDVRFFKYNPIAIEFTNKRRKDGSRIQEHTIITKDNQEYIERLEGRNFVICSPVTYVGRNRTANNARYLYSFTVDLDGVGMKQMRDIIHQMQEYTLNGQKMQTAPVANIIVNSGHGLHLYYLLKKPVPLFPTNIELLNKLKHDLTDCVWNAYTSTIKNKQYQGVLQGFRLPGTKTKFGETIRAFYNEDSELFSLSDIAKFCRDELYARPTLTKKEISDLEKGRYNPNGVTRQEAERRWPEWYARVVIQGNKEKKRWHIKRDLYDWWLTRLWNNQEPIVQGHRYFCMMALATYAVKCDIPEDELKNDAFALVKKMDKLTTTEDNHFTEEDVQDALQAYKEGYCTFPKNSIEYLTGLRMPEGIRRNGRKQIEHLEEARLLRDFRRSRGKKGAWDENNGRHKETYANSKKAWIVATWRYNHPTSTNKSTCAKETGLTRPTVRKWWDGVDVLYKISNYRHFHWKDGATVESVSGLFKSFLVPGYNMTPREKSNFAVSISNKPSTGWYEPMPDIPWQD